MDRLAGKVAVVTGAARGIGASCARLFAAQGATVYACDLLDPANPAGATGIRHRRMDVSREADWRALIDEALADCGRLDILVNNAGIAILKPIVELSKEEFDRVLAVNLAGTFMGLKYGGGAMIAGGGGSIINISSSAGVIGNNAMGAYSASKFGIRGMAKVAALEMGRAGVRVNTIMPGPVDTGLTNPDAASRKMLDATELCARQPIRRFADPDELANACLFLASDEASYITGAELSVDGGMTIGFYMSALPGAPADDVGMDI